MSDNKKTKAKEAQSNIQEKFGNEVTKKFSQCHIQLIGSAVFFIFVLFFLGVYNAEYLFKLQASSLFLNNDIFTQDTFLNTASVLVYVSRFLTQFLYYPILGAVLIGLLLTASQYILCKTFKLQGKWIILSFLPSLFVLLSQTTLGYGIYDNFECSVPMSITVGLFISSVLAWATMWIKNKWNWIGWGIAGIVCFRIAISCGIYGLLPLVAVALNEATTADHKKGLIMSAISIVLLFVTAYLTSHVFYNEEYWTAFFSPLPDMYFKAVKIYALLSLASVILISVFKQGESKVYDIKGLSINIGCLLIGCFAVYFLSYRDANYRTTIKIQHLTDNLDWKGVLKEAGKVEKPTVPISMYRIAALKQTDELTTQLFNYPVRYDTLATNITQISPLIYSPDLYFYTSAFNQSYMWNMERWTTTGRSVEILKKFAQYAIVKNEQKMAHKYINLLKQTLFYKSWAEQFEKYIGHIDLLKKEQPEYAQLLNFEIKENNYIIGNNIQETFASYTSLDAKQLEFRILMDLYFRNLQQFTADITVAEPMYKKETPQYIQEALCMYTMQTGNNVLPYFNIDNNTIENVQQFLTTAQVYRSDKEKGAEQFKSYQGMYCYFMAFANPFPAKKAK